MFGIAIRVAYLQLPFVPGITNGKLKMNVKVGKHGATMTGRFNLASPKSTTSICGGLLEAVTCAEVRNAEEGDGGSGDGIGV